MTDIFDRFKPPDEPIVVAECAYCRREIYAGDEVKRIDDAGGFTHNNYGMDCAIKYAEEQVYDAMGTINIRGEID
ncbi:hypothetical protein GCM10008915_36550 [Bifidobacterium pullorum subsp. gallinarum]